MADDYKMPMLRLMQCGCTSGHDSLIRLWIPENCTDEDLDYAQAMWDLMMRGLRRTVKVAESASAGVAASQPTTDKK